MKKFEFYTNPSPHKLYNRIIEFSIYTLIIDNNRLMIKYETDINAPSNEGHYSYKKITEEFSLKEFFNLKQSNKYRYLINAQNRLNNFLYELITKYMENE